MGLLSWLFPGPEQRVERARRALELGRPDEARLEIMGVEHEGAAALLEQAEMALCQKNLDAALEYGMAGDEERLAIHLELADQFHHGGLEDSFRDVRRQIREARAARKAAVEKVKADEHARLMDAKDDPEWLSGGASQAFLDEREEAEQRLMLMVENYPQELRATVGELGVPFATAVLALEDGQPDAALQGLLALPDDAPLVLWERARAAHALGDAKAAARAVRGFAKHAGGHHPMGRVHSGTYLAQLLAEVGEVKEALTVIKGVQATDPKQGGFLYAQLLWANGELAQAESQTRALIRKSPKAMPLYSLLARVRMAGDQRVEAMRALEAGLEATHCAPGKCGFQPPDLDANRLLATLYLEDGVETERALELADTAAGLVQQPTLDDAYLATLVAAQRGAPEHPQMVERLTAALPEGDPRRTRLLEAS